MLLVFLFLRLGKTPQKQQGLTVHTDPFRAPRGACSEWGTRFEQVAKSEGQQKDEEVSLAMLGIVPWAFESCFGG